MQSPSLTNSAFYTRRSAFGIRQGWLRGFEPPTPGTTIRCSNQLSYNHHVRIHAGLQASLAQFAGQVKARTFETISVPIRGSARESRPML